MRNRRLIIVGKKIYNVPVHTSPKSEMEARLIGSRAKASDGDKLRVRGNAVWKYESRDDFSFGEGRKMSRAMTRDGKYLVVDDQGVLRKVDQKTLAMKPEAYRTLGEAVEVEDLP
jgi:hypothetical protein